MNIWPLSIFFTFLLVASFANAQSPKEIEKLKQFNCKTVIYKTVDGDTLDMLLFFPEVEIATKMPVMIFIHGGGWGGGNKYKILGAPFFGTLESLLNNGIACATIEYRLTRLGKSTAYDCVVDCKDAVRFLMKNADEYSLDVNRMGVWGDSAGGHLCLMTALADNNSFTGDESLKKYKPRFQCIASYYPLTSFVNPEFLKGSNFEKPERFIPLLGGLVSEKQDMAKLLSPAEWIGKNSPPVLLLHGEQDKVLPIQQSIFLEEVGKARGADIQLLRVKNADHSFNGENPVPSIEEINKIAAQFIIEKLTNN
ncbi:MAG: alpha/beta hydrolase [Prolixibacteraceae bacterium]|nr:alpha/beta hydrolase [Prolixibacteraceae bacterium]